ncbi:sulfite exporter TauE/SafE family protein [Lujinxingia litoralis]|uniref:Probable membrane transporter protein n=1 Tax=Lujinxingia litoralis TaxID=2211119 RepID=A0A328C4N2_9DELT|nr:sulfite exporter TauE/SafE family protein [Lujinxingia litoralis]RAL21699.1 sulfite exporter TauE/SafE family protein [Lujinxingia litoralis]
MVLSMEMWPLAVSAGLLAGMINTLAGSGSLVVLPLLMVLGLDASQANGTNRVGVMVQTLVGIATLARAGKVELRGNLWVLGATSLGALCGAALAVRTSADALETIIGWVMLAMLAILLMRPQSWLRHTSDPERGRYSLTRALTLAAVGFWGGFLQAGVGVLMLMTLVLGLGKDVARANALKLMAVCLFTSMTLPVFVVNGQVDWGVGAVVALGQGVGAWLGARIMVRWPGAGRWVRWLLIVVVSVSAFELLVGSARAWRWLSAAL